MKKTMNLITSGFLLLVFTSCTLVRYESGGLLTTDATPMAALLIETVTVQNGEEQQAEIIPTLGLTAQYSAPSKVTYIGDVTDNQLSDYALRNNISPDGQWVFEYLNNRNSIALSSVTDPSNIQYIDISVISIGSNGSRLSIIGWAPDSSSFLVANAQEVNYTGPFGIVNIINGVAQEPIIYHFQAGISIDGFQWLMQNERLFVITHLQNERVVQIYEFTNTLDIINVFEISYNDYPEYIFQLFTNNVLTVSYADNDYRLTSYILQDGILTRASLSEGDYGGVFCGVSPDSEYVLIMKMYNPIDDPNVVNLNMVDITSGEIIDGFLVNSENLHMRYRSHYSSFDEFCTQSADGSMLAFNGNGDSAEPGIYIWNWETEVLTFWPGDYYVVGWNNQYNGFTVIETGDNGINRIEVLTFE